MLTNLHTCKLFYKALSSMFRGQPPWKKGCDPAWMHLTLRQKTYFWGAGFVNVLSEMFNSIAARSMIGIMCLRLGHLLIQCACVCSLACHDQHERKKLISIIFGHVMFHKPSGTTFKVKNANFSSLVGPLVGPSIGNYDTSWAPWFKHATTSWPCVTSRG